MLRKAYTPLSLLFKGLLMLVLGLLFFYHAEQTLRTALSLMNILVWLNAADTLLKWLIRRGEDRPALGNTALLIGLALFLSLHPNAVSISASALFGVWMLVNAIGKYLYVAQLWKTRSRGRISTLLQGILYTMFAVSLMTDPLNGAVSLTVWLGLYCLVSGVFLLVDAVREWLGTDIHGKRVRQRIRIKPPVLLTTLAPMKLLRMLDDPDEEAEVAQWTRKETVIEDARPDLEIFLHLSKSTAMGFGHMDIALGDTVYTYGCYDASSNRLFGILSDGVLVKADRAAYIPFCLEYAKKRLIGYGVVLTDKQKEAVRAKLTEFLQESTRWYPSEENREQKALEAAAGAEFYKIGKGPFKTYNFLTTNCVAVANMLSGSGGVDLMNPQGIITPGTYSEFLDRQFLRPKSIVVARTVYR